MGFAHGVMNTDNMSVASITIDYGPFGFVDEYNPNFIPNTSDDTGRYDLESQASAVVVQISDTNQTFIQEPCAKKVKFWQCLGFYTTDFWPAVAYESAEQ